MPCFHCGNSVNMKGSVIMKKTFSVFAALLLAMLCFVSPVYAESDADTNSEYTTRTNDIPTEDWDLSVLGQYNLSSYAQGTALLYSNYNFTGVSQLGVSVRNLGQNYTITVKIVRNTWLLDYTVRTFYVSPGERAVLQESVTSSGRYYLSFSSPCCFDGFVV